MATLAVQAVFLLMGWMAVLHITRSGLSQRVYESVLDENARAVTQFHAQLLHETQGSIDHGSPQWERIQSMVEAYRPPGGAQIFLLGRDNRVLCHPTLRTNTNLRRVDYSEQQVTLLPRGGTLSLARLNPRTVAVGKTEFLSGPAALAFLHDPERGVKIVVYMPDAVLEAAGRRMTTGLLWWGLPTALLVLVLTGLGSAWLVRRYDSMLVRVNRLLEREVQRRTRKGLAIRDALVFGLAKLADYRDTDTGRHLERICRYSEMLALELRSVNPDISVEWIERLKIASSMHDIGKVGIPDSILLKPGILTPRERTLMELHTTIGAETLLAIRRRVGTDALLDMSIQVALEHHEKWDGTGYPHKLSGSQISMAARIVALADIYDALTSKRVYKDAMSHDKARRIIVDSRGSHLDPDIVDAFERVQHRFDEVRAHLQSDEPEQSLLARAVDEARKAAA
ncbi:MAG: HD domain-containing protein [Phycisphaerales bacterium]|nr:HD domain-containing protein [Phycisphaerales bacterium]